jgi:DNA-binding LacI/PurR family transcriptional regulator
MRVTLKQIAERAGVSRPAVSAVLNNAKGRMAVSDNTRRHIMDIAAKMGYVPNLSAQMLSGKPSKAIGLINIGIPAQSTEELLHNLTLCFSKRGYNLLMDSASGMEILNRKTCDIHREIKSMASRNMDGVVLFSRQMTETVELLHQLKMPYVVIDQASINKEKTLEADFSIDKELGAKMAGQHLLSHGHKKIFFVCSHLKTNREKFDGLKQAWTAAGLPTENCQAVEALKLGSDKAEKHILHLIKNEKFTACLCSNDFIASRLMLIVRESGLNVPGDLALIGYDGNIFASFSNPPITTVIQPFAELAEQIGELLIDHISNTEIWNRRPEKKIIRPKLFIGGSCGCKYTPPRLMERSAEIHGLEQLFPDRVIDHNSVNNSCKM